MINSYYVNKYWVGGMKTGEGKVVIEKLVT